MRFPRRAGFAAEKFRTVRRGALQYLHGREPGFFHQLEFTEEGGPVNGSDVPRIKLSIDGNQALFVFGIFPQKTVSISGLSIGSAQVGVYNDQGTLSVSNCLLSSNVSAGLVNDAGQGSGGASMTVANSIISSINFPPSLWPCQSAATRARVITIRL